MARAIAVHHGVFGRIAIYRFCAPMVTHAHREAHLTFLVDGPDAQMPVSGMDGALNQDTVIACAPWAPHSFVPINTIEPSLFLVLYVSPFWFTGASQNVRPGMQFGCHMFFRSQKIKGYVNKLVNLLLLGDRSDLIEGYIYELTQESHDESWRRASESEVDFQVQSVRDFRVRRSIDMMKTRVGQTLAIEEIAAASGLSRPHFFKLFREQTGLSPNVYLNTLRVEQALEQLQHVENPVHSISDDLGFSSQASFSRFFTSHVGVTPSEYRQVSLC